MTGMRQRLLTVSEVANWLAVSPAWVRQHATGRRRPALPALRLGKSIRFHEDQVNDWIRQMSEARVASSR